MSQRSRSAKLVDVCPAREIRLRLAGSKQGGGLAELWEDYKGIALFQSGGGNAAARIMPSLSFSKCTPKGEARPSRRALSDGE